MAISATDRFETKVDRILERGSTKGKRPICDGVGERAAAIREAIEEDPALHQQMLKEYTEQQSANNRGFAGYRR